MPTTKTWVLRERDYDGDPVIAAFASAKQADEIRKALGQTGDEDRFDGRRDFYVDSVPILGADLAVEDLGTVYWWRLGWYWDGTVRGDEALDPDRRLRITGLPEHYRSRVEAPPVEVSVATKADETNYTCGFWVHVSGPDEADVKARADECRTEYGADPLKATADLWLAWTEGTRKIPSWIWDREENQGLLDALRARGIQ